MGSRDSELEAENDVPTSVCVGNGSKKNCLDKIKPGLWSDFARFYIFKHSQ